MKKLILVVALAAAPLAACSTLQGITNTVTTLTGSSVSAQQVSVAASSFDALETAGTAYLRLPLCGSAGATAACRTAAASRTVYSSLIAGRQARNQLEAQITASGTGSVSIYNTLVTAISAIQPLLASK